MSAAIEAEEKRQAQTQINMENIKVFLEDAVVTIGNSYKALEQKCVNAVNTVGTRCKAGLEEQAECLARINAHQET